MSVMGIVRMSCVLSLLALVGCASSQKVGPQFWPPAPDAPRVQYLRPISSSADVVEKKSVSLIDLGEKETVIPIVKPYGIAVRNSVLYICDTVQAQVVILDLAGKKASTLKGNKGPGALQKPIGVAVDAKGFIYVSDTSRKGVMKYGPDGAFVTRIADGDMKPVAVAVDDMYLYVLDQGKGLVRVYDLATSEPVRSFGQEGDQRGWLSTPLGIGVSKKGGVYVTNLDGRIVNFDRDGHPIRLFGKQGTGLGEYNRPRSITFDEAGVMYIVDAASQNVRLLNENFQILMSFGEPGTLGSLNIPAGIVVSSENLDLFQKYAEPDFILERVIFVVSQFGDSKVGVYGLGKKKGVDYDALLKTRQEEIKKAEEALDKEEAARKEKEAAKGREGKGASVPQSVPAGNN